MPLRIPRRVGCELSRRESPSASSSMLNAGSLKSFVYDNNTISFVVLRYCSVDFYSKGRALEFCQASSRHNPRTGTPWCRKCACCVAIGARDTNRRARGCHPRFRHGIATQGQDEGGVAEHRPADSDTLRQNSRKARCGPKGVAKQTQQSIGPAARQGRRRTEERIGARAQQRNVQAPRQGCRH